MGDEPSTGERSTNRDGSEDALDPSTGTQVTECTVALPEDLAADLEAFCRSQYVHRDEAIRSLLAEWLDRRPE